MYFDTRIDNNDILKKYQFLYQNDLKVWLSPRIKNKEFTPKA